MHTQRSLYNSKLCLIFLLIRPLDGTSVTFTQSKINEGLMFNDPLYCIMYIIKFLEALHILNFGQVPDLDTF